VLWWIDVEQPAAEDGKRSASGGKGTSVGGGIDATGEPTHDGAAGPS
jgi:hypothetical protein